MDFDFPQSGRPEQRGDCFALIPTDLDGQKSPGGKMVVDAGEYGESTYDNALPWTRIAAVPHVQYGNFTPLLGQLDARHDARSAKDVEYQWWVEDVRKFREEAAKKSISLNEAERRAERDKFDAQRKHRAADR